MDSKDQYVYILTNEQFVGLLKIGRTDVHPNIRAIQLSRQTGVIGEFSVAWHIKVPDSYLAEKMAHFKLKEFHHQKEFYKVELAKAIEIIKSAIISFFNIEEDQDYQIEQINEALAGLKVLLKCLNKDTEKETIVQVKSNIKELKDKLKIASRLKV